MNEFAPELESQEFSIDENPGKGQEIGQVAATDQESHQSLSFQVEETDDFASVRIDSASGILYVMDSTGFDYETKASLLVRVTVSDSHEQSLSSTALMTIQLNDMPEPKQYYFSVQPDAASGRDAVISFLVPDNNYGSMENLLLYAWTQEGILNVNRSLIDFDLSGIPSEASIDSAYLSIFFNPGSAYATGHSGETSFTIQRLITAWDESTVSWSTQPAVSYSNLVQVSGAIYPNQSFPDMDISSLVEDYTSHPSDSYGFCLKFVEESPYKILVLSSSDHEEEQLRPKLEVYYTVLE
ncbi:MAG: DNRLRE domain-containing protein [Bacteroidales bacterium]|nr:DNRLRE domain-containing protein [Bacteroidales bacterium]